jgi:hypothetical protein
VERGDVDGRVGGLAARGEHLDGAGKQLLAPLADLMGVERRTSVGGPASMAESPKHERARSSASADVRLAGSDTARHVSGLSGSAANEY